MGYMDRLDDYACRIQTWASWRDKISESPTQLLQRINENKVLKDIESGDKNLLPDSVEGHSGPGERAIQLVQEALIEVRIMKRPEGKCLPPKLGYYRKDTKEAIGILQDAAGIKIEKTKYLNGYGAVTEWEPAKGQRFGKDTLKALKIALTAHIQGKDWESVVKKAFGK